MTKKFYSRLSYSFGNEDWKTEQEALAIQPDDTVLCVTASGDRPLHLLLRPCKELIAIDANPVQNFLLHLKKTAMEKLEYKEYLGFLGAASSCNRLAELEKLLPYMNEEAAVFWKSEKKKVQKGVLYQGLVERLLKKAAVGFKLLRGRKVKKLFEFECIEKQKKFIKEEWDNKIWQKIFQFFLNPQISKLVVNDPGLYTNVDSAYSNGKYIYHRANQSMCKYLAKHNYLMSLILRGVVNEEAFPPYLQQAGFIKIKTHLRFLKIRTENVINYLENAAENSIDCFSLSDIASYMDQATFNRLMKEIHRTAKPGARFCIRELLSRQKIPESLESKFIRNAELEQKLEEEDICFLYRFMTGTLKK